jgi:hypothetical protein
MSVVPRPGSPVRTRQQRGQCRGPTAPGGRLGHARAHPAQPRAGTLPASAPDAPAGTGPSAPHPHSNATAPTTATPSVSAPLGHGHATATAQRPSQRRHDDADRKLRTTPHYSALRTAPAQRLPQHHCCNGRRQHHATATALLPQPLRLRQPLRRRDSNCNHETRCARVAHARLLDRQLPHSFCERSHRYGVLVGAIQGAGEGRRERRKSGVWSWWGDGRAEQLYGSAVKRGAGAAETAETVGCERDCGGERRAVVVR